MWYYKGNNKSARFVGRRMEKGSTGEEFLDLPEYWHPIISNSSSMMKYKEDKYGIRNL